MGGRETAQLQDVSVLRRTGAYWATVREVRNAATVGAAW